MVYSQVWKKGVDTEVFNPKFKSLEMRSRLTDGHPEDPIMVHVGRLGAEKNLKFLKVLFMYSEATLIGYNWPIALTSLSGHFCIHRIFLREFQISALLSLAMDLHGKTCKNILREPIPHSWECYM